MKKANCRLMVAAGLIATATMLLAGENGKVSGTRKWKLNGADCDFAYSASYDLDFDKCTATLTTLLCIKPADASKTISQEDRDNWGKKISDYWSKPNKDIFVQCTDGTKKKDWTLFYVAKLVEPKDGQACDYNITLHEGDGGMDAGKWYRDAANQNTRPRIQHEGGHYLGCPDEYTNGGCIDPANGNAINKPAGQTNSIMNRTWDTTKSYPRHYSLWIEALKAADTKAGRNGLTYTAVPEPGLALTLGIAVAALALRRRSR